MGNINQAIKIDATDHGNIEGRRTISIEIKVKPELFLLPDMLVGEGALIGIENELRKVAKVAVISHINAGRALLKSLGEQKRGKMTEE